MSYTKEDYIDFYNKYGRYPDNFGYRNQRLNEKQLNTKYEKYLKKQEKNNKSFEVDERWNQIKALLPKQCALIAVLRKNNRFAEIDELYSNAKFLISTIDGAHVFSRQKAPWMKYDIDNVVPLNRYSHSMLDFMKDPIDGHTITKEEQTEWWKLILGDDRWNRLNKKYELKGDYACLKNMMIIS